MSQTAPSALKAIASAARSSSALTPILIAAAIWAGAPSAAWAACTTSGTTTTCAADQTPVTTQVGGGPTDNGRTVEIQNGATISTATPVNSAISLGDDADVTVRDGGAVQGNSNTGSQGPYDTGGNTIEFGANGSLVVENGGKVLATGTDGSGEAVNIQGSGGTITNSGLIQADNAAAIWFQNTTGRNTIVNEATGVIQAGPDGVAPRDVMGSSGNAAVTFTNRGTVNGNLVFFGGDDILTFETGSHLTGSFNGGAGDDIINLSGNGNDSLAGAMLNFETLNKTGTGTWTLTGAISGVTVSNVQEGTLRLTGDNTAYTGRMVIDQAGTLEARAQSLPTNASNGVENNGLLRFIQNDAGSYGSPITGTGRVEKTLGGVLTLTGTNDYSGGTIITGGTLAVGSDAPLGATTGGITFNGGTLRLTNSFNLAATRAIDITANGGTIDTPTTVTTVSQGITGPGALTKTGVGTLTLTGANTYGTGVTSGAATTIAGGMLRIGNGGTTGSITGNVVNNSVLEFNRSDVVTFDGLISGTGFVRQAGAGTTILTADHTYTAGTLITDGILQLGNGGTTGSIAGNINAATGATLAFNRADDVDFGNGFLGAGNLEQNGSGTLTLTTAKGHTGSTSVNAGTLRMGVENAIADSTGLNVAQGATFDMAGFNQAVDGPLVNNGLVAFSGATAAGGTPGTIMTVNGNVTGTGVLRMATVLGADDSATDRLVINGGAATGQMGIQVVNAGGAGGKTVSDGIMLVQAVNGATTAANAFSLSGPVAVGAYEYLLFRGGVTAGTDENWYLRSELTSVPSTPLTPATPVAQPSGPVIPLYRPEVAVYSALPSMAREIGLATLGTFHERQGNQPTVMAGPGQTLGWGRAFGQQHEQSFAGTVAPSFDGNLWGLQTGLDLFQSEKEGHLDRAGLFFGYARANGDVRGFALGQLNALAGKLQIDGYSLGAYWTHIGPGGWYVDSVAMGTWLDTKSYSYRGVGFDKDAGLITASIETGYPIHLMPNLRLEPQAQMIFQHLDLGRSYDRFSSVEFGDSNSLNGRVGARLETDLAFGGMLWQPYAKVNVWHSFSGTDNVTFANTDSIVTQRRGTSLEVGGGVVARLNQTVSLFATGDYTTAIAGPDKDIVKGNLGLKVTW